MADTDFNSHYSDSGFWGKVKGYAKVAGKGVLEPALKMYYAARDSDTPVWARTTIIGALGYFISPLDVIPDLVPAVGYTDDISVLIAAAAAVAAHIKAEHIEQAKTTVRQWFGD